MTTTTVTPVNDAPTAPYSPASRRSVHVAVAAVILTAVALPGVVDAYTISLATTALVLAVLAMSTQLLVGVAGLPAFGQVAYFGVGAYTAALLAQGGTTTGPFHLAAAAVTGAIAAAVTAPLALRTRATGFLMVTFAIQSLAATAAARWTRVTGGDEGLHTSAVTLWAGAAPLTNAGHVYLYVLACVLALGTVVALLLRSRLGLVLRGCADHEPRMAALGHRVGAELTTGYVAAGALAGAGGALLVAVNRYVSPADMGFDVAAVALLAAAIGAGTMTGAVAGAFAVVAARDWLGGTTGGHGPALLGLLFLTVAYGRPHLTPLTRWARSALASKGKT
ncbi:amino acid/amide ABC transporter membrane protein 2 (HAAT family) [Micromonospora pisi]|uniref:Amino acid/amide ABC transporter membrane protein 2 (HAAT family) n=1 Tax=Micromonospora pisi TaxID=589240 RepID=A0A495JJ52_9ACTN|nr:branched-chain amino acid ABC transporter permease [Micromonospora pisi]RKR88414.1 amino acid/amide ABC transporter membrane protein 2 (HAAT family) [Micromonospora pisi]